MSDTINKTVNSSADDSAPEEQQASLVLPEWVQHGLDAATPQAPGRPVDVLSYPYTYAYDFLRRHPHAFGIAEGLSRSEAASVIRARTGCSAHDEAFGFVACALADAAIAEFGEKWPEGYTPALAYKEAVARNWGRGRADDLMHHPVQRPAWVVALLES